MEKRDLVIAVLVIIIVVLLVYIKQSYGLSPLKPDETGDDLEDGLSSVFSDINGQKDYFASKSVLEVVTDGG